MAVICAEESIENTASTPAKLTLVTLLNWVPWMTTVVPAAPLVGVKLVIARTGAAPPPLSVWRSTPTSGTPMPGGLVVAGPGVVRVRPGGAVAALGDVAEIAVPISG